MFKGKTGDSIILSQEIYHDYGARQIFQKLNPEKGYKKYQEAIVNEIVIKYTFEDVRQEKSKAIPGWIKPAKKCNIVWVAEKYRWGSLEYLEEKLKTY